MESKDPIQIIPRIDPRPLEIGKNLPILLRAHMCSVVRYNASTNHTQEISGIDGLIRQPTIIAGCAVAPVNRNLNGSFSHPLTLHMHIMRQCFNPACFG